MYEWAVNQSKLERAKKGTETEEQVKENYIKLGGKIINEDQEVKYVGDGLRIVPKKIKESDDEQTEDEDLETALTVAKKKRLSRIP